CRGARVPEGQGHRAAADGEASCGKGETDRAGSAARATQSVRAPDRPPGGRGDSGCDHRKHWRRVLENGTYFITQITIVWADGRRPGLSRPAIHPAPPKYSPYTPVHDCVQRL